MPDLAILVPTRGRPENIRKVISAWDFTNAWDHADLVLVADADDPEIQGYRDVVAEFDNGAPDGQTALGLVEVTEWMPMVHKLNAVAHEAATGGTVFFPSRYFALGFAGDDHLPQTIGWAKRYLDVLRELGTGMVYGDDGYQGRKLSTEWAVTADVVRELGRMVPAPVEHMYCDNSMMDLFGGAKAMRHLPEIRIEHMHPYAGKAETDAQYDRVNHRDQFKKDRRAYESWLASGLGPDVVRVQNLRKGRPDVIDEPTPARPRVAGSAPRRVDRRSPQRSGPTSARQVQKARENQADRMPRHFKNVRAATPEDIMITLADFAVQVPAGQEIVELGVFQGRTALQLAWGASMGHGAHVTAIDPWDLPGNVYSPPFTDAESRTWAHHWVDTLGYADKIRLVHAFSQDAAETWDELGDNKPVGLLFVDGDHTKEGAKLDIVSWAPHLAPGARIAVDDYGHPDWPGVGEAVDELVAEGVLEPIEIFHDRLAVTRLTAREEWALQPPPADPTCHEQDHDHSGSSCQGPVTAITSEGVHPTPDDVDDLFDGPVVVMDAGIGEAMAAVEDRTEPDSEVSKREAVSMEEAEAIDISWRIGLKIDDLNTFQLRALARVREIVLGTRKDKRDAMLQALRDGA